MFLVARDEFLRLGGFDERYFLYYEDRDLSRRYLAAGLPLEHLEALEASHEPGRSSCDNAGPCGTDHDVDSGGQAHGQSDDTPFPRPLLSFLGWLQYVAVGEGLAEATRQAGATVRDLHHLERVLQLAAVSRLDPKRVDRKRRLVGQFGLALRHISTSGAFRIDGASYYPDAVRAVCRATRAAAR